MQHIAMARSRAAAGPRPAHPSARSARRRRVAAAAAKGDDDADAPRRPEGDFDARRNIRNPMDESTLAFNHAVLPLLSERIDELKRKEKRVAAQVAFVQKKMRMARSQHSSFPPTPAELASDHGIQEDEGTDPDVCHIPDDDVDLDGPPPLPEATTDPEFAEAYHEAVVNWYDTRMREFMNERCEEDI